MAKVSFKNSSQYNKIFEDLEKYLAFCKEFGYRYEENDLYSNRSNAYKQYSKYLAGKPVKNNWEADGTK